MPGSAQLSGERGSFCWWRHAMWGTAVFLLALPAIAMRFTTDVNWTASDFITMGIMLGAAFGTFDLVSRMTGNLFYRSAAGIAVVASFLLVWVNLAVGIIGTEDDPANLMFGVVLIIALSGALVARFQAAAMSRAMAVTAFAQALVGSIALLGRMGAGKASWPLDVIALTLFFTGLWLGSAFLFRYAHWSKHKG